MMDIIPGLSSGGRIALTILNRNSGTSILTPLPLSKAILPSREK
jgi:hypothetical protein